MLDLHEFIKVGLLPGGKAQVLVNEEAMRAGLIAAGWAPPFDPADHELSPHDWMELVEFAGKCEVEGFSYAADEYAPGFKDQTLAAAIEWAPLDRLKALLRHHREAVDTWWERDDAIELIEAHQDAHD